MSFQYGLSFHTLSSKSMSYSCSICLPILSIIFLFAFSPPFLPASLSPSFLPPSFLLFLPPFLPSSFLTATCPPFSECQSCYTLATTSWICALLRHIKNLLSLQSWRFLGQFLFSEWMNHLQVSLYPSMTATRRNVTVPNQTSTCGIVQGKTLLTGGKQENWKGNQSSGTWHLGRTLLQLPCTSVSKMPVKTFAEIGLSSQQIRSLARRLGRQSFFWASAA